MSFSAGALQHAVQAEQLYEAHNRKLAQLSSVLDSLDARPQQWWSLILGTGVICRILAHLDYRQLVRVDLSSSLFQHTSSVLPGMLTATEEAAWLSVKHQPWMGARLGRAGRSFCTATRCDQVMRTGSSWKSAMAAAEADCCLCLEGLCSECAQRHLHAHLIQWSSTQPARAAHLVSCSISSLAL